MKKVENIKDFDKLIEAYSGIEKLVLDSKYQISLESSCNFITDEIVNDLITDLESKTKILEGYTVEHMGLSSIVTESSIKLKKAKRNKDIELIEGVLDSLLINVINERKGVVFSGDGILESYANNVQFIHDCEIEKYCGRKVVGLTEAADKKSSSILNTIRNAFASKHDKIVARDQQWLKDNKKKLTGMSYDGVELEVPSDYKVTFANLINKHDIFDKNFKNGGNPEDIQNRIKRFEDKSGNLKNGLDNYFRTGSSRREIGLRKVSGDEAKSVVSSMIDYCKDFLSGKKLIEDKLDELNSEAEAANKSNEDSKDDVVKEHSLSLYLKGDGEEITSPIKGRNIVEELTDSKIINLLENNLVFISEEKFKDGKVLQPRVPKNFLVDNGYEDDSTPRVCFSTSIDKALIALSSNLKGKEFFVYKPINVNKGSIVKPSTNQVPDVKITGEVWVTKPVKIKNVKKIRVIGDGESEYEYKYGNNTATLYDWKWEEISDIKESVIYEANEEKKDQNNNGDDDDWGLEDDPIDDIDTEDDKEQTDNSEESKEEPKKEDVKEEKPSEEVVDSAKMARDRQTGITVLMTIAEERYFDYIDILKSLLEE